MPSLSVDILSISLDVDLQIPRMYFNMPLAKTHANNMWHAIKDTATLPRFRKRIVADDQGKTISIRSTYTTTITVLLGQTQDSFVVHEDLIRARSNYFKAASAYEWTEGKTKTIQLADHEPLVFKAYLESVYVCNVDLHNLARSHLDELATDEEDSFDEKCKTDQKTMHALVKFYILGDYLGDSKFKDDTVRAIIKGVKSDTLGMGTVAAKTVFDSTPPNCGIQKLVADIIACVLQGADPEELDKEMQNLPSKAIPAVLKALAAKRYGDKFPDDTAVDKYLEADQLQAQ